MRPAEPTAPPQPERRPRTGQSTARAKPGRRPPPGVTQPPAPTAAPPVPGAPAAPVAPAQPRMPDFDAKFRRQAPQLQLPVTMRDFQQETPWLRGAPRAPQLREPEMAVPSPEEVWDEMHANLAGRDLPSTVPGAVSFFNKIFWGEEVPTEDVNSMRVIGQAAWNMFWRWGQEAMYQLPKIPERIAYTSGKTGAWVNMPVGGPGTLSPYSAAMLASLSSEAGEDAMQVVERGMEQYAETTPEDMRQFIREGEIGYTFMMHPERLAGFREDVAAGMSVREAVNKHQDFWNEMWMNALIDPAMFLPTEAMSVIWPGGVLAAKAFGKGLSWGLSKTIGRLPVGKWLTALSSRTIQRYKAGQAADAVTEIVLRLPGDEDMVAGLNRMLRGDTSGFDILSENTRKVFVELTAEFQDDGIASLDDLVTRYVPDLADGWQEDVVQGMIRDHPEYVPYLVQEAVSKRTAIELGIPQPGERGVLARAFDFTSGVLKEHWLGTNPAYMLGNMQDNAVKALMFNHWINPFDLGADAKVMRYMEGYGSYVPTVVMDGFIADELGVGGLSRTAQVPIPGIGKPAEMVDFWSKMFGTNLRARYPWIEAVAPERAGDLARAFDLAESPGRLAGVLDKANWASLTELGRGFSGSVERSARVQVFFDTFSRHIEDVARPRLVQSAATAGLGEDVARILGDSTRVRSPVDIIKLADELASPTQPITRLSDLLPEGSPQEMLGRMATELDELQKAAISAGTSDALDTLRGQVDELFGKAEAYARQMSQAGAFEEVLSNWRAEKMREIAEAALDRSRTLGDELLNMTKYEIARNPDRAGVYWPRYFDAKSDVSQTVQQEVSRIVRERATDMAPEVDALMARYEDIASDAGVPALNYEDWGAFGETLAELRGRTDESWRGMWSTFLDNPNVDDLETINLAYDATAGIWQDVADEASVWRDGYLAQARRRGGTAAITREAYEARMEEIWRRGFDQVTEVWNDITVQLGGEAVDVRYVEGLEIYTTGVRTDAQALGGRALDLKPAGMSDLTAVAPGATGIFDPDSGRLLVADQRASHFELLEQLHGPGTHDWYWYDDQMKTRKVVRLYWDEVRGQDILVVDRYTGQAGREDVLAALEKLREAGVPGDAPIRSNFGEAQGDLRIEDTLDGLIAKASAEPESLVRYWGLDEAGDMVEFSPSVLGPDDAPVGVFDPSSGALNLSVDPKIAHEALAGRAGVIEEAAGIAGTGGRTVRIFQSGSLEGAVQIDPAARLRNQAIDDTIAALEAMERAGYSQNTTIVTMVGYPDNPAPGSIDEILVDLRRIRKGGPDVRALGMEGLSGPVIETMGTGGRTHELVGDLTTWDTGMGVYLPDEGRFVMGELGTNHEDIVQAVTGAKYIEDAHAVRIIKAPEGMIVDAAYADDDAFEAAIRGLQQAGVSEDIFVMVPNAAGTNLQETRTLGEWLSYMAQRPRIDTAPFLGEQAAAARGFGGAPTPTSPTVRQARQGVFSTEDLYQQFEQGRKSLVGGRWVQKLPETWLPSEVDPMRRPGAYWGESYPYWEAPSTPRGWQPVERAAGEIARPEQAPVPSKAQLDEWLRKGNINADQYNEYLMQGQRAAQSDFVLDMGTEVRDRLQGQSQDIMDRLSTWRQSVADNLGGALETRQLEEAEAARMREALSGLGSEWAQEIQNASVMGAMEVRRILFDYSVNQNWEEVLKYFVPFSKWQVRNPIVWTQIMAKRPWVFSAVTRYMRASEQIREERDLTQRFEGTVPVPQAAQGWLPQLGPGAEGQPSPQGVPQQGYWAVDPRSLFSLSGQFREPFISPGEEELSGWKQAAATAARAPEYLGMHFWPWVEYPLQKMGLYGDKPPWGMLGTVGRAIPAARRLEEQIGEARVPGSSWMRDYNVRRRIAEMQAEGLVDAETAAMAQYDQSHPIYQQALQDVNKIGDFTSAWRAMLPYGLKYASPGELAIRGRREEARGMPETRAAYYRGGMPASRTYSRAIAGVTSQEQSQWMAQRDAINARYDRMLEGVPPWHPRATELNSARWAEIDALGEQPEAYTGRGYEFEEGDRDSVLFALEQQRPRVDQFMRDDGSTDWEAFNAAEAAFLADIPRISARMGMEISEDEYDAFRNRYRSPTELAWQIQKDRMGKGWDRYGELRALEIPEREHPAAPPFGQDVGTALEPSLGKTELLRNVPEEMRPWVETEIDRRLSAGWESSEIARWLEGQGLPFEAVEDVLGKEGYGPRGVASYAGDIIRQRPWLAGQDLTSEEWGDFQQMAGEQMPGMFTPRTDFEAVRDDAVGWFYEMMPQQRDEVREALRVPDDEEFSDWFDALDPQAQQWTLQHADYMRSTQPLPTEGERLDVELDMLRWAEYGGEWTELMDKYFGDQDSPRSKFWDYWYENKHYFDDAYRDDDVVQATLSKDVRSFLAADAQDPLYEEALKRLEGYYDPEEAERWQQYPDLVDQAETELADFYDTFDFEEKPPDGEDRDWWDDRTQYQKDHPVMMWFYYYDKYLDWWGDREPGSARPIRPTPIPTPTPTPMPTPVPTPAPSRKPGGGGGGGGGIPEPPPPPPGLGSRTPQTEWLGGGGGRWLS